MKLFKKHFYNFKSDLRKLMDGEPAKDNDNDQDKAKDRDAADQASAKTDQELDDIMESAIDVLDSLDFALMDFTKGRSIKRNF